MGDTDSQPSDDSSPEEGRGEELFRQEILLEHHDDYEGHDVVLHQPLQAACRPEAECNNVFEDATQLSLPLFKT